MKGFNSQDNAAIEKLNCGSAKSKSKPTAEPQYEECEGDVTCSNVPMDENPAYQPVVVVTANP